MQIDLTAVEQLFFGDLLIRSQDFIFILELKEMSIHVVYVNDTALTKLGYTLNEINEIGLENIRKPMKTSKSFAYHLEELKEQSSAIDYAILTAKDGTEYAVEVSAKVIHQNDILYNVAIARDISLRVSNEENLRADIADKTKKLEETNVTLQSYQKAIDEHSILTISDTKGIIIYANENFLQLSGYTKEEVLGKPHNIVRHSDTPRKVFQDLWHTILKKEVWKGTIKNRKKNGDFYIVDTVIVPLLDTESNISQFLSIRYDVTEIDTLAHTNPLTGVANRPALNKILSNTRSGAIALIDINRFHQINDFYGENIGNQVIKAVAMQIKSQLSKEYQLFHLQGDQFIIFSNLLINQEFKEEITRISEYLNNKVLIIEHKIFYISTTIALSFEQPDHLLSSVNLANRYAKLKGLAFHTFSEETSLEEEYKSNIEWTNKIRKALIDDRFTVFFQPIVDTKTQDVVKYESLVRMIDEDGSIISPFFFLDKAKKSNQYTKITKKVIEKSFSMISAKRKPCSINLTIEDIESNDVKIFIFQKLQECTTPEYITFELVESEGIENFKEVDEFIQKIKAFGCSLAIDDFGTGYSNFEYLLKLNADIIKIDGSLIKDIDTNRDKFDIVKTIVSFAKTKNLQVVAEFVSSEAIYKEIKLLEIEFCQGYFFDEPKPIEQIKF
ncbi:MAG: EAL domain-containing protein [Sulfurimonadaceae bacterium]|jgi:PAS domain S-box-containing protein/diguanylate cyclase (GGDEF)-like protein|nr:EAL domain-containing protein [Sulfurimonadaceae bacterium]